MPLNCYKFSIHLNIFALESSNNLELHSLNFHFSLKILQSLEHHSLNNHFELEGEVRSLPADVRKIVVAYVIC